MRDSPLPACLIDTALEMYIDIFEITDVIYAGNENWIKTEWMWYLSSPINFIFLLSKCIFEGRETFCPQHSKKILRHLYGESFMTPDHPELLSNHITPSNLASFNTAINGLLGTTSFRYGIG